jgi:Carboxypeptidase Taq (M32) metallopeptidase
VVPTPEQAVAPALGKLLDALAHYGERLPRDSDDASLIRVARRDFQKMIKIPPDHVTRANAHGSAAYNTWTRARPANDFAAMVPYLERTLDLSREYSSYFAPYKHVADPHIDDADEGVTTASICKIFSELKSQLVPMVGAICEQPVPDDSSLRSRSTSERPVDSRRDRRLERRPDGRASPHAKPQEAIDIAQRQSSKSWELRAAMSMARLWRDQGSREEARELLAPVKAGLKLLLAALWQHKRPSS